MITDSHRKIADIAASSLSLGDERRAKFMQALANAYPVISIPPKRLKLDPVKLRTQRKLHGWSQTKLGKKAGIGLRQYQNIEKGHTGTSRQRMVLLAEILSVTLAEIT